MLRKNLRKLSNLTISFSIEMLLDKYFLVLVIAINFHIKAIDY
jgi:hypothetical protein